MIVGAPNGTHEDSVVKNTGFVYECHITQNGQCSLISALSDDSSEGCIKYICSTVDFLRWPQECMC